MQEIYFPSINLKSSVSSVAFRIGNIDIYWYAILIVSSIIIALLFLKKDSKKYNIDYDKILELILWIMPISIISARLYYVIFKMDYYINNPFQILNFRSGGLAIYGGIIAGIIVVVIFCRKNNIKILDMLDMIAPYLALGQAIGRWGNFFNVEAYGIETKSIFRMGINVGRKIFRSSSNIFI